MKFGLIKGRHDIPDVDEYIFDGDVSPVDVQGTFEDAYDFLKEYKGKKVDIYVTGLTMALVSAMNAARSLDIDLTLYHYDRENNKYFPQEVIGARKNSRNLR